MSLPRLSGCVLLICIALALGGCQRASQQTDEAPEISLALAVESNPPVVGASTLRFTLKDASGQPIDGGTLDIRGDMSHAGMPPVLATVATSRDGVYTVPFTWTMAGDWFLTVDVRLPDGTAFTQRFDLQVAGS